MIYKYGDNESKRIPDEDIQRMMKAYGLTQEEACEMWLEDEGIEINPEQQALVEETKGQKVNLGAKKEEKKKRNYTKAPNEDKETMVTAIVKGLEDCGCTEIDILNKEREVNFRGIDGKPYRITLAFRRNDSKGA